MTLAMPSTGIAVIVRGDQVARVLHVTGLDRDGFMFETAAEALAAT